MKRKILALLAGLLAAAPALAQRPGRAIGTVPRPPDSMQGRLLALATRESGLFNFFGHPTILLMRFYFPVATFLLAALSAGPCLGQAKSKAQAPVPVRRIIDVHLHARNFDQYGPTPPPNPISGRVPAYRSNAEVVALTLAELKKYHVERAIISGTVARVSDFLAADPARFIGSLDYPNTSEPLPDTAAFRRLFAEGKFRVFGELGLQYEGQVLTDPALEPYLAICERRGIPVAVHTGLGFPGSPYSCCPKFRTGLGNPQLVEEVLVKHPKLKLQLMHMGYPHLAETKALLYIYPQLHADMAVMNWVMPRAEFYDYLKALITAGYGQRLMYGSDQMAWPDAIGMSIESIEKAPFLSEAQKQDIFYNNAARFYGLKEARP